MRTLGEGEELEKSPGDESFVSSKAALLSELMEGEHAAFDPELRLHNTADRKSKKARMLISDQKGTVIWSRPEK